MGRGITNNAVEFLVQLAIDEDKSRATINKFINSISDKTIKFTYAVNVGESNKNIKAFLDKQNGKVLKVIYDVDKTASNRNFKTFLDSHKQSTGVMVYDVDVKKTQANVNASLNKIKAQKLLTDLDVNKAISRANINKYISEFKPKKILAQVTVDNGLSNTNINGFFDKQKTRNIDVALKLAKGAFNEIREKSKEVTITGVKTVLQLDVNKTKETIKKQIENMKLPKFKVDVIAKVTPNVVQPTKPVNTSNAQNDVKPSNKELIGKNKAKEEAGISLSGYVGTIRDVKKQIKKEFSDVGKEVTLFEGNVLKAQDAFIKKLEQSGAKLNVVRDAQTKEISKISATVRNSENEVITTVYKPLVASYDNLNAKVKEGAKEVRGFVAQIDRIDNKEVFDMDKATSNLVKKFEQAKHKGYLLDVQIDQISKSLRTIGNNNDVAKLEKELDELTRKGKQQVEVEKMRNNVIKQREQLLANVIRTEKLYSRTHDKDEANKLKSIINRHSDDSIKGNIVTGVQPMNTRSLREYSNQLSILQTQYSQFHAKATEETKNQMGILSALKVAMEKFPIWMIASTAFYGSMRTLQTFGEVVIDVDKKMTDLKKVMSEDTDFEKVFDSATKSAETFGKTISESLDAYVMFAKQGYKGDELEGLSNAAIVAGNVGDIEAGKASEYMIASLLQWDKDSSQAMSVVDSWNEISNNFATTVENLAQGQAKAGATARALGMDFDQLNAVVGTLNARTKQSGNEIGNFVKSTFANLVSNKGKDVLDSLGVALEDGSGNMRDVMEIYKDVAKEYVKLNQADKNAVTLGLAGKYHISRMQTLLDDLGSAESMYENMYDTSKNSANSAMEENQKYMQSLEARINLARVEIEKLSLAIGEAFLSEGMITALQLFSKMLGMITKLVDVVGALPIAFLATVTALTVFSNRFNGIIKNIPKFKDLANKLKDTASGATQDVTPTPAPANNRRTIVLPTRDLDSNTDSVNKNTTAVVNNERKRVALNREISNGNVKYKGTLQAQTLVTRAIETDTRETDKNTESKKKARNAMALFTSGFGVWGLGAIGLGLALEGLLGWIGKVRREQEELKNQQEQTMASFKTNETVVMSLSQRYKELSESELSPDSEEYAELLEVQNELASILPELKTGEDAYGNAILVNSEYVSDRVDLLKDQLELEKQIANAKKNQEEQEAVDTAKSNYSDSKKDLKGKLQDASGLFHVGSNYDSFDNGNRYDVAKKANVLPDGMIQDAKQLMEIINDIDRKINDKGFIKDNNLSDGDVATLKTLRKELIQTFDGASMASMEMNKNLAVVRASATKNLNGIIDETENLSDEAKKSFYDVTKSVLGFATSVEEIDSIEEAFSGLSFNEDMIASLESFKNVSKEVANDTTSDAQELSKSYTETFKTIREAILKTSNLDPNSDAYKNLETALKNAESSQYDYQIAVAQVAKEQNLSLADARAYVDAIAETGEEASNSAGQLYELETAIEKVSGVSSKQIDDVDDLIFVYETLSKRTNLTTQESEALAEATSKLSAIYPYLSANGEIRIDVINLENTAMKNLHEAYELASDGILNEEERRTLEQAQEIATRMRNLQLEADSIARIEKAYNNTKKISDQMFVDLVDMGALPSSSPALAGLPIDPNRITQQNVGQYISAHGEAVRGEIEDLIGQLNTSSKKVSSNNAKAQERAREESKKTATETDKVKAITDKYNLTLEKNKTALDKISNDKKKYATHSASYRKALKDENSLLQKQIELYQAQAKDLGGVVSQGTSTPTQTSVATESRKLSGWNHNITSPYGAQESFRKAPHTGVDVDGYMGERLDANVSGKVIARGYTKVSGNYVKIQDANGYQHFYGHLQSITAKLDQMINVGEEIGKIGATGNVVSRTGDGSHLHYEIKLNGKQVNPTSFANNAKGLVNVYSNVGTTTTTTSKATGNSNQANVWNYFKSKGLSDNAVAGIMGNIQQESNFNANAGKNAPNNAFGLVQWRGSRREGLNAYAKSIGKSASDLQVQLDYIWKELNSTEKKSLNALQSSKTVKEHASSFNELYERSGEKAGNKGHTNRLNYATNAYNSYAGKTVTATSNSTSAIGGGSGSAEAQAEIQNLMQLEQDVLAQILENNFSILNSVLDEYSYRRSLQEKEISYQDAVKQGLLTTSEAWEQATNAQYNAQKAVRQSVNDELWQLNQYLKRSDLTEAQRYELLDRQADLNLQLKEAFNGIKEYYSQVVQGRLDRFDKNRNTYQTEMDWESVKIQSVDPESERYVATLERANKFRQKLVDNIKEEQKYIDKQLASGEITIEMYQTLTERAKELKKEAIETVLALQQTNLEIVQAGVHRKNEKIEDIDFNINRSVAIQNLYEENSADQLRELNYQLEQHKEKLTEIDSLGKDIKSDMKNLDFGHAGLEELEKQLESNTLAWYSTKEAIQETEEAIKKFNESIDEEIKDMREDMADKIIDALKEAYSEAKEIKLKAIEDEIKLEEKRHEKVMKQYQDELDMFNDIISAKRREIEDSDRDRTHDNNISDLEAEMQKLVARKTAISGITTYDAKKERKELDEQIAEVQKQIDEEYYQYSKELQLQALDDELEERNKHIEEQQEIEDETYKENIERLDGEKEYWTKHYEDLINDERRFHEIRKTFTEGTNEQIKALVGELSTEIQSHIETLKASLPDLEDTLNGTMEAVGTNIRDTVIFELEQLLEKIEETQEKVKEMQKTKSEITNEFGNSYGIRDDDNTYATDKENGLTENDLKVLLAKVAREGIVQSLDPVKNEKRIDNIVEKTNALAKKAREGENGSKISATMGFDEILATFSQSQKQQVGKYLANNYGELGFSTEEYNKYLSSYGSTYYADNNLSRGDSQVLMAKYMKEYSRLLTSNEGTRNAISSTADTIAKTGRENGSVIVSTINYEEALKGLSKSQLHELGLYMKEHSSVISDGAIRSKLEEYAEKLIISNSGNKPVGLDTGGMTTAWGSSGGVDGKGGKYAVLHEREVVLNPIDTQRMFKVSAIMETIMSKIGNIVKLPTLVKPTNTNTSTSTDYSQTIHINIDKMNGSQSDIDNLSNQIANKLLREKGKR